MVALLCELPLFGVAHEPWRTVCAKVFRWCAVVCVREGCVRCVCALVGVRPAILETSRRQCALCEGRARAHDNDLFYDSAGIPGYAEKLVRKRMACLRP